MANNIGRSAPRSDFVKTDVGVDDVNVKVGFDINPGATF
jgi:hypothetical protein